jgi:large subunit ribosomal protein L25
MSSTTISAETRAPQHQTGRALRRTGKVPGVYYTSKREVKYVEFDNIVLSRLLKSEFGLLELQLDGETLPCVIREVQRHPVHGNLIHIDLFGVQSDQLLKVRVQVNILGVAEGVKTDGGTLDVLIHELEIECLPAHLPSYLEVDVSKLEINDGIRIGDLSFDNITIHGDPSTTILHVMPPRLVEEVATTEEGEDEVADSAEPEVITEKKEDSES